MDEGTYAVGEDGAEIKDENLSVRDILQQNEGDASVAETVAMDDRATKDGENFASRIPGKSLTKLSMISSILLRISAGSLLII